MERGFPTGHTLLRTEGLPQGLGGGTESLGSPPRHHTTHISPLRETSHDPQCLFESLSVSMCMCLDGRCVRRVCTYGIMSFTLVCWACTSVSPCACLCIRVCDIDHWTQVHPTPVRAPTIPVGLLVPRPPFPAFTSGHFGQPRNFLTRESLFTSMSVHFLKNNRPF